MKTMFLLVYFISVPNGQVGLSYPPVILHDSIPTVAVFASKSELEAFIKDKYLRKDEIKSIYEAKEILIVRETFEGITWK